VARTEVFQTPDPRPKARKKRRSTKRCAVRLLQEDEGLKREGEPSGAAGDCGLMPVAAAKTKKQKGKRGMFTPGRTGTS